MYQILLRLKIVKTGQIIEVKFDERLSFKDNMRLLYGDDSDFKVFDPLKRIFLDENIPLENFHIETFMFFYLL